MTEKQSILGRIAQLTKANVNALLDRAEDPQKMLDQMVRDYTNSIAEAEDAVATTIGNMRMAEADYNQDLAAAQDWGQKAGAASQRADQYRIAGDAANADRFDALAKVAISKQIQAEGEVKRQQPALDQQRATVDQLKNGLAIMKDKLAELKSRRDSLVARQKSAQAQQQVQGALSNINILDPTSELSRYEDTVRRQEAKAQGQAEIAAASLDSQFAELQTSSDQLEIEARLAQLKGGPAAPAPAPAIQAAPSAPALPPASVTTRTTQTTTTTTTSGAATSDDEFDWGNAS
jgi:phage shock protein A